MASHDTAGEITVFTLGAKLLERRWSIFRWMLAFGVIAAVVVLFRPALYLASASFVAQASEGTRSNLAALAEGFGVNISAGNQTSSPDFYVKLIKSRVMLDQIAADSFVVPEMGGRRMAFADLFEIKGRNPAARRERAIAKLDKVVAASVVKSTGVIEMTASTKWPSVSYAIVDSLLRGVNNYNLRMRQTQAAAERRFVDARVAVADSELRAAEDRLAGFLTNNRQFGGSAELSFVRDRLQREVSMRQQVFTTLKQADEDARIREIRDTPVISTFDPPNVRAEPQPRGRIQSVLGGMMLGAFFGVLAVLISAVMERRRQSGDADAAEFLTELGQVGTPVRWLKQRVRSGAS
jgi:uncharacterized protein involved in exopolysaccharide biosynthesis